ncbi:MAG: DUF3553 domain-containing protein [Phycisphaerales bacterium]|nr:DUF3553 domain-containing protein [Phycisphaerales bacterium]
MKQSNTTETQRFQMGDRVIHASKPEWGVGIVATSSMGDHEGVPCQRLAIRFDRAGLKTVSTAFADIQPAGDRVGVVTEKESLQARDDGSSNPIHNASAREIQDIMTKIPDAARDPFSTPAQRLKETLALYRFTASGGPLIDWAVMQSGLSDPLTKFTRPELEEFFGFFEKILWKHLGKMVREARDVPAAELVQIRDSAPPQGRDALQRLHRSR